MTQKKVHTIDLATLDIDKTSNEGAWMQLRHPGENYPLEGQRIKVMGEDSKAWRQYNAEMQRKVWTEALKRKQDSENGADATKDLVSDSEKSYALAKITVAWEGIIIDGEDHPCTEENARKLYERFSWIRDQVDRFIANRRNFLQPKQGDSSSTQSKNLSS